MNRMLTTEPCHCIRSITYRFSRILLRSLVNEPYLELIFLLPLSPFSTTTPKYTELFIDWITCSLSNLANRPWPQAPIDSRGMRFSPCARFDSVVELLSPHPIIEQFPGLLHSSHSVISSALLPRPLSMRHNKIIHVEIAHIPSRVVRPSDRSIAWSVEHGLMHCYSVPKPQKKHQEHYKNEIPTPNRSSVP